MTMRPRILVTNWVHETTLQQLALLGDVDANESRTPWPRDEVMRRAEKADAILAFMTDCIDAPFLAHCRRLRVVACALKGYDNFDMAACSTSGVWVTIVPDLLTEPTAELAVGLAIGLARNIRDGDALVRSGTFEGWRPILYGTGLDGSVVAIVGMGRVGRAIAQRLSGFGCRMLGVDPAAETPPGMIRVGLNRALESSDYVILCAPLTPGARHQIGADALSRMNPDALLINVGRGSVVDENAVLAALESGKLGG
jgi:phosphonate dehydrogenase